MFIEFLNDSPLIPIWINLFSKIISLFLNKNVFVGRWEFEFVDRGESNDESSSGRMDSGPSNKRRSSCSCGSSFSCSFETENEWY